MENGSNFKLSPVGGGNQLYLPAHMGEGTVAQQEMLAQNELMGTPEAHGAGSIHDTGAEEAAKAAAAERLDKDIHNMLDPRNVLDLKTQYDSRIAKAKEESKFDFDKASALSREVPADAVKRNMVEAYTQTGASKENPREVPESVKGEISRMMDLSYEKLEARAAERDARDKKPTEAEVIQATIDKLESKESKVKVDPPKVEKLSEEETLVELEKQAAELRKRLEAKLAAAKKPAPATPNKKVDDKNKDSKDRGRGDEPSTYEQDYDKAHDLAKDLNDRWDKAATELGDAGDEYAKASAEQRSAHYGREGEIVGNRFTKRVKGLFRKARFIHNKRAAKVEQRTLAQRDNFRNRLNAFGRVYRETLAGRPDAAMQVINMKLHSYRDLEGGPMDDGSFDQGQIVAEAQHLAHSINPGEDGEAFNKRDQIGNWLSSQWRNSSKGKRVFKLGGALFVAGAGVGALAATGGAAGLVAAGLGVGTTYGGGQAGSGVARSANKRWALNSNALIEHMTRAQQGHQAISRRVQAALNAGEDIEQVAAQLDITPEVQEHTQQQVQENAKTVGTARTIGRIATSVGFSAGFISTNMLSSGGHSAAANQASNTNSNNGSSALPQNGGNPLQSGSAAPSVVTHTSAAATQPNVHDLPFRVAEHMQGGTASNAMNTVQHGINVANSTPGAPGHYALETINGYQQVTLNHNLLNAAQEAYFNTLMEGAGVAA